MATIFPSPIKTLTEKTQFTWKGFSNNVCKGRYYHATAEFTNNTDGYILACGGTELYGSLSAEAYNISKNLWAKVGNMNQGRVAHTATLLTAGSNSGKVLATGGIESMDFGTPLSSSEIYDPTTESWVSAGTMVSDRAAHTATDMVGALTGKILLTGGITSGGPAASCELYDQTAGTFAATGSMAIPRYFHQAALLDDGYVFVVGGNAGNSAVDGWHSGDVTDFVERYSHTSTNIPGTNKIVIVGGYDTAGQPKNGTQIFEGDYTGNTVTTTSDDLDTAIGDHAANFIPDVLNDGYIFVTGGYNTSAKADVQKYDITTNLWLTVTPMNNARYCHTATVLPSNASVLVVGGFAGSPLNSCELYDVAADTWAPENTIIQAVGGHTATLLNDGNILIAGGGNDPAPSTVYAKTQTSTDGASWTTQGDLNTARCFHTATLLSDGSVLVTGGVTGSATADVTNSVEIYDSVGGLWTTVAPMNHTRAKHTAELLSSGKVLVSGGIDSTGGVVSATEIYNPATNVWTVVGGVTTISGLYSSSSAKLSDGSVLISGGFFNSAAYKTLYIYVPTVCDIIELYNPGSETWTTVSDRLDDTINEATIVKLATGNILIAGGKIGIDGVVSDACYLYDYFTRSLTPTSPMNYKRQSPAVGLVSGGVYDGYALAAGGIQSTGIPLNTAELYDYVTDEWVGTDSMYQESSSAPCFAMGSGKMMIFGGIDGFNFAIKQSSTGLTQILDSDTLSWSKDSDMTLRDYACIDGYGLQQTLSFNLTASDILYLKVDGRALKINLNYDSTTPGNVSNAITNADDVCFIINDYLYNAASIRDVYALNVSNSIRIISKKKLETNPPMMSESTFNKIGLPIGIISDPLVSASMTKIPAYFSAAMVNRDDLISSEFTIPDGANEITLWVKLKERMQGVTNNTSPSWVNISVVWVDGDTTTNIVDSTVLSAITDVYTASSNTSALGIYSTTIQSFSISPPSVGALLGGFYSTTINLKPVPFGAKKMKIFVNVGDAVKAIISNTNITYPSTPPVIEVYAYAGVR